MIQKWKEWFMHQMGILPFRETSTRWPHEVHMDLLLELVQAPSG